MKQAYSAEKCKVQILLFAQYKVQHQRNQTLLSAEYKVQTYYYRKPIKKMNLSIYL